MIACLAVVVGPPILVPEVAAGTDGETSVWRDSCLLAARTLAARWARWVAVAAERGVADSEPVS